MAEIIMLEHIEKAANANGAYVYFMHHDSEDMLKIGKAIDCKKRWNLLGNTFDFSKSYIKKFNTERSALQYERSLHKLFSEKRLNLATTFDGCTEWFCSSIIPEILKTVPNLVAVEKAPEEPFKRKK